MRRGRGQGGRKGGLFTIEIAEEDRPRRSRAREQRAHSLLPRSPARLESIDSRCSISVHLAGITIIHGGFQSVYSFTSGGFSSLIRRRRRRRRRRWWWWRRNTRGRRKRKIRGDEDEDEEVYGQGAGRGGEDFNQGSYEARPTRCRVAASLRPIDAGIGSRV